MDQFFEADPPKPRETRRLDLPTWTGPSPGVVPGSAPVERVLAQNDQVGVAVVGLLAYPNGIEFEVVVVAEDQWTKLDPFFGHPHDDDGGMMSPKLLRFGVEFSDGRRGMNTRDRWAGWLDEEEGTPAPEHPVVLNGRGGHGGGGFWSLRFWLSPLPPPGSLQMVCEWPDAKIPLTKSEIDGSIVGDAAARSQVIFDFGRPPN
jgi:hypothetical protein